MTDRKFLRVAILLMLFIAGFIASFLLCERQVREQRYNECVRIGGNEESCEKITSY